MKPLILIIVMALMGCTAAQKNWRDNLYVDVSAGGTEDYKATTTSAGVSYPLVWNVWATAGVWNDFNGHVGPYWGISYSWAPFTQEKTNTAAHRQTRRPNTK